MPHRLSAAALAVLAFGTAHAEGSRGINLSGYGTLSVVNARLDKADFVENIFQPTGAGFTRRTSMDVDSKLGVQVDGAITDDLFAVLQVVSKHQYDNSYRPQIEWANLKYRLTPDLSVRVGRIALPTFLVSETRMVGYANALLRMPVEVYASLPITSNDGIDASYRTRLGSANSVTQVYFGRSKVKLPGRVEAQTRPTSGIAQSLEVGSLTLRGGFTSLNATLESPDFDALFDGLEQFAAGVGAVPLAPYQVASAQAAALARDFRPKDNRIGIAVLGASYDPGDWFAAAELARTTASGVLPRVSTAWYVNAGYRLGSWTPYATYSKVRSQANALQPIDAAGLDPQSAGAAAALSAGLGLLSGSFTQEQSTISAGLRWDAARNVALKAQYDRLSTGDRSSGRLGNVQPDFVPGTKAGVFSLAVDFVF